MYRLDVFPIDSNYPTLVFLYLLVYFLFRKYLPIQDAISCFLPSCKGLEFKKLLGHTRWGGQQLIYPLVICYIAIENDHRNSGFSH